MKTLIIQSGKVKRSLEFPFEICGSRDDIRTLSEALKNALSGNFSHGWIKVYDNILPVTGPPRDWED